MGPYVFGNLNTGLSSCAATVNWVNEPLTLKALADEFHPNGFAYSRAAFSQRFERERKVVVCLFEFRAVWVLTPWA